MTFQDFIEKYELFIESVLITGIPEDNFHFGEHFPGTRHFTCTVLVGRKFSTDDPRPRQSFEYHMGSALKGDPQLEDLLYCLASDASAMDEICFEDWAENLGYDSDSRKAEKTYWACLATAKQLVTLLGNAKFNELIECEEEEEE